MASTYAIARTDDATNFSSGDVIELTGSLSDGRNFNLKLTVGKDFQVGASYAATLTNMKTQLEKTGDDATMITLNDGSQVKAGDIFGTGKEITIGTSAATGITFTSAKAGPVQAGIGGGITNVTFSGSAPAEVATTITKGTDPAAAESSFTFSKGVGYGTAITVGGKTYELVKDARDVTNRSNEAVVVDDLTDLDAVASKFADAINGVANKNLNADGSVPYTAVADGTTVKITTSEVGSDVKAMEITTPYGDEVPTVSFKFDPSKIKAGSYMTISDGKTSNTYEFVKTGEKPKSGNTAIEISDFNKMPDAKAIGDAFSNVAKGATVEVADDGTVTITANEVDGSIPKLNVSFYEGKGGLKLQIGDTSEEYNQLKVSVGDMHTVAMGIDGIDIRLEYNQNLNSEAVSKELEDQLRFVMQVVQQQATSTFAKKGADLTRDPELWIAFFAQYPLLFNFRERESKVFDKKELSLDANAELINDCLGANTPKNIADSFIKALQKASGKVVETSSENEHLQYLTLIRS